MTPGKWSYAEDLGEVLAHDPLDVGGTRVAIVEVDADGILISAAPDLLAACEKAMADCREHDGHLTATAWTLIRHAIVKAGRKP